MSFKGPREKIWENGPRNLTDAELLCLILGTGPKRTEGSRVPSVVFLAEELLHQYGSLTSLLAASPEELIETRGMGKVLTGRILALKEVCQRSKKGKGKISRKIEKPRDVLKYFNWLAEEEQEVVCALFLATNNEVIRSQELFRGGISKCLAEVREIFRAAFRSNAAAFILVHNHPSGELSPSKDDLLITLKIKEAGELLGIALLDHVIVSKKGHFSFAKQLSAESLIL